MTSAYIWSITFARPSAGAWKLPMRERARA
jgi:hypothetical protein